MSWARRLRRPVPVKLPGSNATMIPAALAWAVELKVRHIAGFVALEMDILLVLRPAGSGVECEVQCFMKMKQ